MHQFRSDRMRNFFRRDALNDVCRKPVGMARIRAWPKAGASSAAALRTQRGNRAPLQVLMYLTMFVAKKFAVHIGGQ